MQEGRASPAMVHVPLAKALHQLRVPPARARAQGWAVDAGSRCWVTWWPVISRGQAPQQLPALHSALVMAPAAGKHAAGLALCAQDAEGRPRQGLGVPQPVSLGVMCCQRVRTALAHAGVQGREDPCWGCREGRRHGLGSCSWGSTYGWGKTSLCRKAGEER